MSQIIDVHGTELQVRIGKGLPWEPDKVTVTDHLGKVVAKLTPFPERGVEGIYPWIWDGQPIVGNNGVIKIDSNGNMPRSIYYNVLTRKQVDFTGLYK